MEMSARSQSYIGSMVFAAGLLGVYLGERVVTPGRTRGAFTLSGMLLITLAIFLRALRVHRASGERRRIELCVLGLYFIGLAALILYFAQSDVWTRVGFKPLSESSHRLAVVLEALWPAMMVAALLPLALVELSYAAMAQSEQVEAGRVRDAALSGLGLAAVLVFAFSAVYVFSERDLRWDLSYFRTSRAGASTRKIAQALTEPIVVSLFFPPANEVREEVAEYFRDLSRDSKELEVHTYDQAVDPARARELGVTANGAVVISRGNRREQLILGVDLEKARGQLRTLDQEIQKRLLSVARTRRVVYLTTGHGERTAEKTTAGDQRANIAQLRDLLSGQNEEVRNLGAAEGLASDVPGDAAVVLVIGPTGRFLSEELAALERYFDRGGRLLMAVDPEPGLDFKEILKPMGLEYVSTPLANDQAFIRRSNQPSDRGIILTASFSSHPSVTTLSQIGGRAPVILIGSGYLEELKGKPGDLSIDISVRAHPATWNDLNKNFQFDPPAETRKPWSIAAAVTKKSGAKTEDQSRAIVLADSDALSDLVLESRGNTFFVLDGIRWLLGEESTAGAVNTEADAAIEHTRKQDVFWFYSTIFLMPAIILGAGFAITKRRGRSATSPRLEARR